jgi:hydrogenase-4 component F
LILVLLCGPPLVASVAAILVRSFTRTVAWTSVALAGIPLATGIGLCVQALSGGLPSAAPTDLWRIDTLSAVFVVCIAFVSLLAAALGPGLEPESGRDRGTARRFTVFQNAFALTMLAAVTANNVALMWVAIEASTIVSAMAIPLDPTKSSVEASWKYLLICSVGIALAFAGTVLAYVDFVSTAGRLPGALNWTVIEHAAASLHPELMQLAFAFILVGYGTKAGLAPMHTWLPDAHSEAPSSISAMMSGVLLAVGAYAIARWKAVVDVVVAREFTNALLIAVGVLSLVVGVFSLVIQRHYKRMLAYSSIEHIGLVAIGLALGPLGVFAALLHAVNHAVAKSATFLLAGRILHRYRTTELSRVSGLLVAMPWSGPLFAAGILALVGLPPFGIFVSEFLLLRAAVFTHHLWLAGVVLLLLLIAFVSLINHVSRMLYGPVPDGVDVGESRSWRVLALAGCTAVLIVLGVAMPGFVVALIDQSTQALLR